MFRGPGRMTLAQWKAFSQAPICHKPKQVRPIREKKPMNQYRVDKLTFSAYTVGEARAEYKKQFGKIPPGTKFEKV